MPHWKQLFLSPVCIGCGSFFGGPALFCNVCYDLIVVEKLCAEPEPPSHIGRKHCYLFGWDSYDPDEFSQLVYRLKSDNSETALNFYGSLLADRLKEQKILETHFAVVPIPSAHSASVHALILAECVAKRTGLPLINPLEKEGPSVQKTLSAAERIRTVSIRLRPEAGEDFTDMQTRPRKYVFVDDVLTTGQSFKQASAALGGHQANVIATLFYRTRCTVGLK